MISSIMSKLTGGPSLEKARAEHEAASKAHAAAREAFGADPSSRRWVEVQSAEERLAQADLVLKTRERREADQRAADEAARRAELAAEANILADQLSREALLSEVETVKTRLIAALIEISACHGELRKQQLASREKHARLRALAEELGQAVPDYRPRLEGIAHDIAAQAAQAAWDKRDTTAAAHVQSLLMSACNTVRGIS